MSLNGDAQLIAPNTRKFWKKIVFELDEVRGCILGKEPLPSTDEVLRLEEKEAEVW